MSSFITWAIGVIQDGIIGVTGGNIFLQAILGLLGLNLVLWRLQVSMPIALMISFFSLAVLSQTLNNPVDAVLGTGATGFTMMLYLVIVFMTGVLLWHLLFKKSGAGQG